MLVVIAVTVMGVGGAGAVADATKRGGLSNSQVGDKVLRDQREGGQGISGRDMG